MEGNWSHALAQAAAPAEPAPDGQPLTANIACRTSRADGAESTRHPLVIHADWSVEVPHDLDSERLAEALGGYLSCVGLVDNAVPALRGWLSRTTRAEVPAMAFRGETDRWALVDTQGCCAKKSFRDAVAAAEHWRSPQHVAAAFGASPRQVSTLARACTRAYAGTGSLAMPPADARMAAEACLRGTTDVSWLWDTGIHPRVVWTIQRRIGSATPLPARFYLGVVWNRPDLQWVVSTLDVARTRLQDADPQPELQEFGADAAGAPHDSLATWLAWTEQNWDVADRTARARWLNTGITRPLILALGEAGYEPDELLEHAVAVGRHPDAVARTIQQWLRAGFQPSPASLTALAVSGIPARTVPARAAVERLRSEAGKDAYSWLDTDLALHLVRHGTVHNALIAIRKGAAPW